MRSLIQKLTVRALAWALAVSCLSTAVFGLSDVWQWNLSGSYGIGAESAWQRGMTGNGVRVAVIDSGVNADHIDLQGVEIEQGYNVIDHNTDTADHQGHGTIITGIIAANTENSIGINGICDDVTIIPIKCFEDTAANVKRVTEGIYLAVDDFQCDVINLSMGVSTDLSILRDAVDYAASKGVIIVSAVGNNGETAPEQMNYPAAYNNVIGVGAHDQNGQVCAFSPANSSVFVTAPGEDLISLSAQENDGYMRVGGTSYATAHVTAMAALAKSQVPTMTVADFRELLKRSAVDAGPEGYDTAYGYGMVSVPGLLRELDALPMYRDIADHWARESIEFCSKMGLLSGTGDNLFSPETSLTRAMIVSILWRMEGSPVSPEDLHFSDVPADSWFSGAVGWAAGQGIVSGYGEDRFGPDDSLTREQMAAIFYRYAAYRGLVQPAELPGEYSDWSQVSAYAAEPLAWAVANGLVSGKTEYTIEPRSPATRAEAALALHQYITRFSP